MSEIRSIERTDGRHRSARRARVGFICIGIVSALLAEGRCDAQAEMRLTVRPHEMATGTTNPPAGEYALKSVPAVWPPVAAYIVTVPPQCTGAHRCPLFVFLPGGGYGARTVTDLLRPMADKYGMILLAASQGRYEDPSMMDSALKETLRRFAIDPDKIAINGRCMSGGYGMHYGMDNLDVFSRIASISGDVPVDGMDPKNKTAQFFFDNGFQEGLGLSSADVLRRGGHYVKVVAGLRTHDHQWEDYDFYGHWLQESWAKPNPADRPEPSVVADPLPALTLEVLTKMTAFWNSFVQEPDSIKLTARRGYLREVVVPVGDVLPSVWMVDMPALAAKYPSVAADLKKVGLTAEQHEAYRIALLSARIDDREDIKFETGTVKSTSVQSENVKFMKAHPEEFKAFAEIPMWSTP